MDVPSRPMSSILANKAVGAAFGGLMGAVVGGSVGIFGTMVQTGRIAGAGKQAKQAAAFMGTIFAAGGAWQG